MPVTASSFDFSWPMLQEGVIRRSEEELSEVTRRGISAAVCIVATTITRRLERWNVESKVLQSNSSVVVDPYSMWNRKGVMALAAIGIV